MFRKERGGVGGKWRSGGGGLGTPPPRGPNPPPPLIATGGGGESEGGGPPLPPQELGYRLIEACATNASPLPSRKLVAANPVRATGKPTKLPP